MQKQTIQEEEYACDNCGYTTPVPNETCPDCGSKLTRYGDEEKKPKSESDELTDEEIASGVDLDGSDGTPLSLESLQEEESERDSGHDSYGDE